jgi:hypothetical protein
MTVGSLHVTDELAVLAAARADPPAPGRLIGTDSP